MDRRPIQDYEDLLFEDRYGVKQSVFSHRDWRDALSGQFPLFLRDHNGDRLIQRSQVNVIVRGLYLKVEISENYSLSSNSDYHASEGENTMREASSIDSQESRLSEVQGNPLSSPNSQSDSWHRH